MTVAIVGGGPVGLLLAAELGVRGVPAIVLNDNASTSSHPKANTHSARSMEIYRRHGISAELRERGLSKSYRTDVAYYTRLVGHELHRVQLPAPAESIAEAQEPGTRWPTPEPQFRSTQLVLEPLLLERARQFPCVDVRFGQRVVELTDRGRCRRSGRRSGRRATTADSRGLRRRLRRRAQFRAARHRNAAARRGRPRVGLHGRPDAGDLFPRSGVTRAPPFPACLAERGFCCPHLRALLLTLDADDDVYLHALSAAGRRATCQELSRRARRSRRRTGRRPR